MRLTSFSAQILLLVVISQYTSVSSAEMYKWVDADGNTHYTQSPPPGDIEGTTVKPPPKIDPDHAKKQLENRQKLLQEVRDSRNKKAEKKNQDKQDAEQRRAACEQSRVSLASYQRPRVNKVDSEGNRVRITEEQRQENIANAKKQVAELCKE